MAYSAEQTALYRRITLRVAPLALLLYLIAFLDRVNVGFAALTMNRDLGISESTYGLAAGIFFIGYMLLAIPSNVMLVRVGAPRWVAGLMLVWGVVGCATAFVHGPRMYIVLRFLLGAAESGFLPGIVYYLTRWLPGARGNPGAVVPGHPLIQRDRVACVCGHPARGWRWRPAWLAVAVPAGGVTRCRAGLRRAVAAGGRT